MLGDIEDDGYKNFINIFKEKHIHAYLRAEDIESEKEYTLNKINSIFKDNELMYNLSKHSGTYYKLKNIEYKKLDGITKQ